MPTTYEALHAVKRGLKDALEMRWEALAERELFVDPVKGDAPCDHPFGAGDLEQSVESARHR